MTTTTKHLEHVLLVFNGGGDGAFKGVQGQRFLRITDDSGKDIVRQLGEVQTIGEMAAEGFTFPEVLADIDAGLLLAHDQQAAQIEQLQAQALAANTAAAQAIAEREQAVADAATLRAKYESPVLNSGVPEWVWRSQAMKALTYVGKKDQFNATLEAAATQGGMAEKLALVDWQDSARFFRNHPTVQAMIQHGLLTAAEADNLWKLAATFPV